MSHLRTTAKRLAAACAKSGGRAQPLMAAMGALALLIAARAALPEPFTAFKTYTFDTLQQVAPRADSDSIAPGTGVVVVDIDDASLDHVGQWPWPRSVVADLIRRLQDAGASAIGLDIVFAEPDRTSPATLAPAWARRHGLSVAPADGHSPLPDYDRELADAMARGRVVTGYGLVPAPNGASAILAESVAVIGIDPARAFPDFAGAVVNLPILDKAAAGQGSFTVAADGHDEVVRDLPLFLGHAGAVVPSLAAEVLRVASGDDDGTGLRAQRVAGPGTAVTGYEAHIGRWAVPIEADGTMRLRYGERAPLRRLSARTRPRSRRDRRHAPDRLGPHRAGRHRGGRPRRPPADATFARSRRASTSTRPRSRRSWRATS